MLPWQQNNEQEISNLAQWSSHVGASTMHVLGSIKLNKCSRDPWTFLFSMELFYLWYPVPLTACSLHSSSSIQAALCSTSSLSPWKLGTLGLSIFRLLCMWCLKSNSGPCTLSWTLQSPSFFHTQCLETIDSWMLTGSLLVSGRRVNLVCVIPSWLKTAVPGLHLLQAVVVKIDLLDFGKVPASKPGACVQSPELTQWKEHPKLSSDLQSVWCTHPQAYE